MKRLPSGTTDLVIGSRKSDTPDPADTHAGADVYGYDIRPIVSAN